MITSPMDILVCPVFDIAGMVLASPLGDQTSPCIMLKISLRSVSLTRPMRVCVLSKSARTAFKSKPRVPRLNLENSPLLK